MAAKISLITAAVLAALANSGPTPSYSLDFMSSLPGQVTFSRSGSRMAVVSGALTTVATNTAAIESTSAGVLGLSIEPASTNNLLQSNTFNTTWTLPSAGVTLTSGQASPDGGSNGWDVAETTINNYHEVRQDLSGVSSGTIMCTSVYIKAKSGAVTNGIGVHNCNQFSNAGALTVGFVDASAASFSYDVGGIGGSATTFNTVSGGSQKLAGGWTRVWVTGTSTATGTKTIRLRSRLYNASGLGDVYTGVTTNGFELAFAQTEYGVSRPTSYKATTTATVNTNADSAIISNISWLNTAVGTLLIEHDCTSGVLLGSGANTVMSGAAIPANRITAKTALAWSGTTSDLVSNGGSTTTGVQPTFGADIRLLATSVATGLGHIKSLKYYPTRLTVTQIQALTAPTSTAPAAGTYRVAAQRAVLNNGLQVISGTTPSMAVYWPTTIGSGARTKVRVSFGNWVLNDTNGDQNPGNTTTIVSATLIHISSGQYAPIYWGGSRTVTATNGQVKINSDDILPSAFPALTAGGIFPNAEQFAIKCVVKTPTGGNLPVGRFAAETGAQAITFDAAVTTISTTDASGQFTATGVATVVSTKGFGLVLEGPFVTGDPMTLVGVGDSIVEGVGSTLSTTGTWFQKAATALGLAYLQYAVGGQSQVMLWKSSNLYQFTGLGNVLVDNTGTNTQSAPMYYPLAYYNARVSGVRFILRPSLNPRSTATVTATSLVGNGTTATVTLPSAFLAAIGTTGTTFSSIVSGATGATTGFNTPANNSVTLTIASSTTATFANSTNATATGTILVSDLWLTLTNQTALLPYPDGNTIALQALAVSGLIDQYYKANAVRDTGDKWIVNGTPQGYTVDGTHQEPAGDDLMATELQGKLSAIVLV